WLVPHDGVFYLLPVFALAAVVFGLVNGLVAAKLLAELPPPAAGPASANRAGQSPAEADSPER
ncbi:heptaprenyl diphosphate synthase, partial [Citrobacter sp. AAK_AS5]